MLVSARLPSILIVGLGLTACGGLVGEGAKSDDKSKENDGDKAGDEAADDVSVVNAVPISVFEKGFLTSLDSYLDASLAGQDIASSGSTDATPAATGGATDPFDQTPTFLVASKGLGSARKTLSTATGFLTTFFGDGGPMGPGNTPVLKLSAGRATRIYKTEPGPTAGSNVTDVYVRVVFDRQGDTSSAIDIFEQIGASLRWSHGVYVKRTAKAGEYDIVMRKAMWGDAPVGPMGPMPAGPMPSGPPPRGMYPGGKLPSKGFAQAATATATPKPMPKQWSEVTVSRSTSTIVVESADASKGTSTLRERTVLKYDDANIRSTFQMSCQGCVTTLPPGADSAMQLADGDAIFAETVTGRGTEKAFVVRSALIPVTFGAATGEVAVSAKEFADYAIEPRMRSRYVAQFTDSAKTPGCATLGTTLRGALDAVVAAGAESELAAAKAALAATPAELCGAENGPALLEALKATCQFATASAVTARATGTMDVCKDAYRRNTLEIRNDVQQSLVDGKRKTLLSVERGLYTDAPASEEHKKLKAWREAQAPGAIRRAGASALFEIPLADFDTASAKEL